VEMREFYCPGCLAQLAVEVLPKGYPPLFDMLPDLDTFYREWLGKPLPDERPDWFQDKSPDLIAQWAKGR
ncbi:MAG: acetone carboxylase subunit gamma, partial [Dehalococcoidia bacterium]